MNITIQVKLNKNKENNNKHDSENDYKNEN